MSVLAGGRPHRLDLDRVRADEEPGLHHLPDRLKLLTEYRQGESDLICQNGQWFLAATCEVPERVENPEPVGLVGVDLGIVEIATTSTRNRFLCRRCGVMLHADVNAARNLAHRGEVEWNAGRWSTAPAPSS